jgi:hypothetical protein
MHTVRSNKAKPEKLVLSKIYPTKMVINIRLLDMQGYKRFISLSESSTKSISLLSIFYFNYFNHNHYT